MTCFPSSSAGHGQAISRVSQRPHNPCACRAAVCAVSDHHSGTLLEPLWAMREAECDHGYAALLICLTLHLQLQFRLLTPTDRERHRSRCKPLWEEL